MKQSKETKKILLSSVLSLVLCIAMLIGTTFAWFTDTVKVKADLQIGTLQIALRQYIDEKYQNIGTKEGNASYTQAENALFNGSVWQPGQTEIYYLAVENLGSLPLNYHLQIEVTGELSEVMEYAVFDGVQAGSEEAKAAEAAKQDWEKIKTAAGKENTGNIENGEITAAPNGHLQKAETDYFALAVHLKEEAGNEYQGKGISADILLTASQEEFEKEEPEETPSTPEKEDPFADYTIIKNIDFTNIASDEMQTWVADKISVKTDDQGNKYLSIKKQGEDPANPEGTLWVNLLKLNENMDGKNKAVYSFDIKVDSMSSYMCMSSRNNAAGVGYDLKLQDGALWYVKDFTKQDETGNLVKILDLSEGKWHHVAMEVDFSTGEITYYADHEKAGTVTRAGITPNAEVRFHVSPYNWPTTPKDKTVDIDISIDNFMIKVPAGNE